LGRPIIRIRNIPESSTTDYTDEVVDDKYIVHHGDLLIGMDGEFHINHWHGDDAYLVQRVCRVKAKQPIFEGYLAHAIGAPVKHFESILMGATVGHLGAMHLKSIVLLIPPEPLRQRLDILNNLLRETLMLAKSSRILADTRDRLLTRLLSGALCVDHLDVRLPPTMAKDLNTEPTTTAHA
jgi:type I restriction enzyme S subunit